jgi:hypothetical protein
MTGTDAIYEVQRRGVDVYVAVKTRDIILRARDAGVRIDIEAIAIARAHRDAILAIVLEHYVPPKGIHVDAGR